MVDLAVVVVTWNVRELVLAALGSLLTDLGATDLRYRVVVVDSASEDDTVAAIQAHYPSVEVIASQDNLGFGRANNLGLQHLGFGNASLDDLPQAVFLLNPDTVVYPGATRVLYDALMDLPRAGLVGARLQYGDGSFQHSAFAFPGLRQLWAEFFPTPGRMLEGRFNGRYPRAFYAGTQPFAVDFVLGATMLLHRDVIVQTQGFDENFFMYCEEIDWAWRIQQAGWLCYCVPSALVTHYGGQSTVQIRPQSTLNLWESRLRLYQKYYPIWKLRLARLLVDRGMQRKTRQLPASDLSADEQTIMRETYQQVQALCRRN